MVQAMALDIAEWGDPQRPARAPRTPRQMELSDRQEYMDHVTMLRAKRDSLLTCADSYNAGNTDVAAAAAAARSEARTLQCVIDEYKHMSHRFGIAVAWTPPKGNNYWDAWVKATKEQREQEQYDKERLRRQAAQQTW